MKKNQHYVFRKYLEPWSFKSIIKTEYNGEEKRINLSGVAQERYFYELSELEKEDFDFIENFVFAPLSQEVKEMNRGWLKAFTFPQKLKEILISKGLYNDDAKSQVEQLFRETHEELHCSIESTGLPLITMIKNKDLSFYDNPNLRSRFCHFVCVQYFRTKKYKMRFEQLSINNPELRFKKTWSLISHVYASNIGLSIYREKYKFILLESNGSVSFITSDQPVINTIADKASNVGQHDIELYYPISPKLAILITNNDRYENKSVNEVSECEMSDFNQLMRINSNSFVFMI